MRESSWEQATTLNKQLSRLMSNLTGFTSDKEAFRKFVEKEVEQMIEFHFRPGGLMSKVSEEERPTIEQVRRWGWRVKDQRYVEQEYNNL